MIRIMVTTGSRDAKLYIFAAAALICAAVFPLPVLPGLFFSDSGSVFNLSIGWTSVQLASDSSFGLAGVISCIRNWGLLCVLVFISVHDTDKRIIPNRCILAILLFAVYYQAPKELASHLLSVVLISVLLLLTIGLMRLLHLPILRKDLPGKQHSRFFSNTGRFRFLGGGDIKLLLVLGLFLSLNQTLCMLLLAGLFGLFSALAFFLRREKNFPFGPGICAAASISLFMLRG